MQVPLIQDKEPTTPVVVFLVGTNQGYYTHIYKQEQIYIMLTVLSSDAITAANHHYTVRTPKVTHCKQQVK